MIVNYLDITYNVSKNIGVFLKINIKNRKFFHIKNRIFIFKHINEIKKDLIVKFLLDPFFIC